jgi:hypothetical protein
LFHAEGQTEGQQDGQTDMTKLIVAFHSSANAIKNTQTHRHKKDHLEERDVEGLVLLNWVSYIKCMTERRIDTAVLD